MGQCAGCGEIFDDFDVIENAGVEYFCEKCFEFDEFAHRYSGRVTHYFSQSNDKSLTFSTKNGACYVYSYVWLKYMFQTDLGMGDKMKDFFKTSFARPTPIRNDIQELHSLFYNPKVKNWRKSSSSVLDWCELQGFHGEIVPVDNDMNLSEMSHAEYSIYSVISVVEEVAAMRRSGWIIYLYTGSGVGRQAGFVANRHVVACYTNNKKYYFFDPNYGEVKFSDLRAFGLFIVNFIERYYPQYIEGVNAQLYGLSQFNQL